MSGYSPLREIQQIRDIPQDSPLSGEERQMLQRQEVLKRAFDIFFSLLALAITAPILVIVALLIKLDSEGPVLYVSERVGRHGKHFRFLKFRTMVKDADALRHSVMHLNERQGNLFKIARDPRTTSIGRILRRYSLDELPQFFCVLTGHMSVVGPRPCLPREHMFYTEEQCRRLEVMPGITGLWQVEARMSPSVEEYFELDLHYVDNWSLWGDLKILLKTVPVVLSGAGH